MTLFIWALWYLKNKKSGGDKSGVKNPSFKEKIYNLATLNLY